MAKRKTKPEPVAVTAVARRGFEVPPPEGPPPPPPDIRDDPLACAEWVRVCGELTAGGRWETADRAIVLLYVQTWARHAEAMAMSRKESQVTVYSNGNGGASPWLGIVRQLGPQVRGLLADLGLTPSARFRRKVGQLAEEKPTPGDLPAW